MKPRFWEDAWEDEMLFVFKFLNLYEMVEVPISIRRVGLKNNELEFHNQKEIKRKGGKQDKVVAGIGEVTRAKR